MKHYLRIILFLLATVPAQSGLSQTTSQNYVKSETFVSSSGSAVTTVQYVDGLGNPTQTVTNSRGTGGKYVYVLQQYDVCGRLKEQSIPAYGNTSPTFQTEASLNWLYGDTHRTTQYAYDALDRLTLEKGPGDLWHNANAFKGTTHGLNGTGEVRRYTVSGNTLGQSGSYAAGALSVEIASDENGHITKTYRDMQDRIVLMRQEGSYETYDTYYAYDCLGNLRFVLPPLASDALTNSQFTMEGSAVLQQYAYYYEYDTRGRCTKKKLPGCDPITMAYDTRDCLISSQDGVQRNANISTYYEYDDFNRQTVMGTKNAAGTKTPLLETFYDDYSFLTSTENSLVGFSGTNGYESSYASAKGLQTGSRTHHLDNPSLYEVTAMYYNAYGEMIQQRSTNHLSGNDDEYIQYNHYTGKELNRKHIHSASGQTTHTEVYTYEYDTADRLKAVRHKLDNYTQATLCSLAYDDIGRNSTKALMNNTEAVGYTYNIRDWQRKIQSTHFTENIGYNDTSGGIVPTNKYHNGNIGAISWLAGNETMYRSYDFSYDAFDRLEYASYTGSMDYNTYYTYDGMGNLTEVMRYGGGNSSVMVDDLEIEYSGNQMVCVDDNATDPSNYGTFNFYDGASQSVEYEYDKNGNMTKDLNKNISSVQYNLLNLPQNITYGTGKSAAYVYDAGGRKLRTSYKASASATAVPTDYCGNMIYEDNVLKQVLVDGGYVTFSGSTPVYHYYLQDHLGNNRVVCNASGTVEQVSHYYPFGGLFAEGTGGDVQRYKYNGKELDRTHGLDWYDYGARHMSPDVGRFTTIDPMAEKYYNISPYAYCHNNPLVTIDPDGTADYKVNNDGYLYESTSFIDKILNAFHLGNKNDRLYLEKNNSLLATYSEGTINLIKNEKTETLLEIKNNNDAENFFQKVISNTDVEWANIRHNDNGNITNTIVNNHKDDNVDASARIANKLKKSGEKIELFEHSHPIPKDLKYGTNLPFTIHVSGKNGIPGDIQTAKGYPGTIFRVYDLLNHKIHYYDGESIYKTEIWNN